VGVGDIYNEFKLFFGVSSAGSSGIKTLFISSAYLKEFWRTQILTSGTRPEILPEQKLWLFDCAIHAQDVLFFHFLLFILKLSLSYSYQQKIDKLVSPS
jgi:hypothetical protein